MINLFIDTNRYLSLYGFSKHRLEEIRKVIDQINKSRIILWLPEQVINEFNRNKERIPLQKIEQIKKLIFDYKYPSLPELPEFEDNLNDINTLFKDIAKIGKEINSKVERIKASIIHNLKKESFKADTIIRELFSAAKVLKYDDDIIDKAKKRNDLDIPPGKKGSYGDAVIWETLLKEIPDKETLDFVGYDKDFKSAVDDKDFSPFLLKEWRQKKRAEIIPYEHLGDFIEKRMPEIEHPDKIIEEEKILDKRYLLTTQAMVKALEEISRMADSLSAVKHSALADIVASYTSPSMIKAAEEASRMFNSLNAVKHSALAEIVASYTSPSMIKAAEEASRLSESLKALSRSGIVDMMASINRPPIEAKTDVIKNDKPPLSNYPGTDKASQPLEYPEAEETGKKQEESPEKSEEIKNGNKKK